MAPSAVLNAAVGREEAGHVVEGPRAVPARAAAELGSHGSMSSSRRRLVAAVVVADAVHGPTVPDAQPLTASHIQGHVRLRMLSRSTVLEGRPSNSNGSPRNGCRSATIAPSSVRQYTPVRGLNGKLPPYSYEYTAGQSHPHARKSPGAISPAAGKCCARRNSPHSIAQTYTPTCCAEEVWSNMARPRPAWQLKVGPRRPCRRPSADAPSLGCHRPSAAPMRSDLDVPKVL